MLANDSSLKPITVACHDCDLLNEVPALAPGESASCVRCDATLSRNPKEALERGLALTFTAILLFIVANAFPFLSFGMEGFVAHTTLVTGIISLYQEGMYFLAACVALTTFIIPVVLMSGLVYILVPLYFGRKLPGSNYVLRLLLSLGPWNMVEIFLIGIIVAAIKLAKMAALVPGLSAWAFLLLIFALTWITFLLEPRVIWERLEVAR